MHLCLFTNAYLNKCIENICIHKQTYMCAFLCVCVIKIVVNFDTMPFSNAKKISIQM